MANIQTRLVSMSAGIAGLSLALTGISTTATSANAPTRSFVAPAQRAYPSAVSRTSRGRNDRKRQTSASCAADSTGSRSFDSHSTSYGDANLVPGNYSGVLEGAENTVCDYYSAIGAGEYNVIDDGSGGTNGISSFIAAGEYNDVSSEGSFIGGGGYNYPQQGNPATINNSVTGPDSFVGAGDENSVSSLESFIGAGNFNIINAEEFSAIVGGNNNLVYGSSAYSSMIGAGVDNEVGGSLAFVGAGYGNQATGNGAFIGGGGEATIARPNNQAEATDSFIGAGDENTVEGAEAFIGAGNGNSASGPEAAIAGGYANTASSGYTSVVGGYANTASGKWATVAGGDSNTAAGILSLAAGFHADAAHNGSFVWSDYVAGSKTISDSDVDQFVARASGGVYFYSNEKATSGVVLTPGSGAWANLSDRNAKTAIAPLDDTSVLAKVAALPIDSWEYKSEKGVRHVGPMAQDFYAAFGTGVDNRHITSIDEDGVALAAIKALHHENGLLRAQNARMQGRLASVEAKDARLERRLDALASEIAH